MVQTNLPLLEQMLFGRTIELNKSSWTQQYKYDPDCAESNNHRKSILVLLLKTRNKELIDKALMPLIQGNKTLEYALNHEYKDKMSIPLTENAFISFIFTNDCNTLWQWLAWLVKNKQYEQLLLAINATQNLIDSYYKPGRIIKYSEKECLAQWAYKSNRVKNIVIILFKKEPENLNELVEKRSNLVLINSSKQSKQTLVNKFKNIFSKFKTIAIVEVEETASGSEETWQQWLLQYHLEVRGSQ